MVTLIIILAAACSGFACGIVIAAILAGAKEEDAYRAGYCEGREDEGREKPELAVRPVCGYDAQSDE